LVYIYNKAKDVPHLNGLMLRKKPRWRIPICFSDGEYISRLVETQQL